MDGTDVRGGVIKCGTSDNRVTPVEEKVLRVAAQAHRETGAVLHCHTEIGTMALEQLDILEADGVDPSRVGFVHVARNPDPFLHLQIAARGAYLCYDGFSKIKYFTEQARNNVIMEVVAAGYGDRILIGGDIARKSDLTAYSGGPGLAYIAGKWLPRFRAELTARGYSEDDIDRLVTSFFVDNPQRYFEFFAPY